MNEFVWKSRFIEAAYRSMMRQGVDLFDALSVAKRLAEQEYPVHGDTVPEKEAAVICMTMIAV